MYFVSAGGNHCPVALWWVAAENRTSTNFVMVSKLDQYPYNDSDILTDLAEVIRRYTRRYNCSSGFTWKGK